MGFFKVDRQIFNHWLWEEKPFSKGQAWIDLIGLANYEDGKTTFRGQVVVCKRGTVYRSISYLADRWGWSRDKTRRFLKLLESDSMIQLKSTSNNTVITLMNYGKFQDVPTADKALNRQQISQQTDSEQGTEIRRIKNNKEHKNNSGAGAPVYGSKKSIMVGQERHTDYDALIPQLVRRRLHHDETEAETLQQG